jgi:hypothetical protein
MLCEFRDNVREAGFNATGGFAVAAEKRSTVKFTEVVLIASFDLVSIRRSV